MSTKELDNYCQKLLQAFIGSNKRWHFNEFHEKLNKASLKISKPTLSQHLKHLQKLKLITRKREGKQRISYGVNWEKLKHLQKTVDGLHAIKRILENETTFSTLRIQGTSHVPHRHFDFKKPRNAQIGNSRHTRARQELRTQRPIWVYQPIL